MLQQLRLLGQQRLVSVACLRCPAAEQPPFHLKDLLLIQPAAYARRLYRRHEEFLGSLTTDAVDHTVAHGFERNHRRYIAYKAPRREQQIALRGKPKGDVVAVSINVRRSPDALHYDIDIGIASALAYKRLAFLYLQTCHVRLESFHLFHCETAPTAQTLFKCFHNHPLLNT